MALPLKLIRSREPPSMLLNEKTSVSGRAGRTLEKNNMQTFKKKLMLTSSALTNMFNFEKVKKKLFVVSVIQL